MMAGGIGNHVRTWVGPIISAAFLLAGALCDPASAKVAAGVPVAKSDIPPLPAEVRLIHSPDPRCGSQCDEWLQIDGPLGKGSFVRFSKVLRGLGRRQPMVLVNSPGGSVEDAMAIGRAIRARHLNVAVSRVALISCPADQVACRHMTPDGTLLGVPLLRHASCASACPLILAGGVERLVAPEASIGVHEYEYFQTRTKFMDWYRTTSREVDGRRVVISRTLVSHKPISTTIVMKPADYTATKSYLVEMGVEPSLIGFYKLAPHESMFWMKQPDLQATKLETSSENVADDFFYRTGVRPSVAPGNHEPTAIASLGGSVQQSQTNGDQVEQAAFEKRFGQQYTLRGNVRWSIETAAANRVAGPVLVADVTFPDGVGSFTMRLDRVVGSSNPEVMRLVENLHLGSKAPVPLVETIDAPFVHQAEAAPMHLVGVNMASTPDRRELFMPMPMNQELINAAQWFDVVLELENKKQAVIQFARGVSGQTMFDQWIALDRAHNSEISRLSAMHGGS